MFQLNASMAVAVISSVIYPHTKRVQKKILFDGCLTWSYSLLLSKLDESFEMCPHFLVRWASVFTIERTTQTLATIYFFVPIFLFLVRSSFIPRVLESCWQGVHSTLMDDIIHLIRGEIPVGEREWVHYLAPSTSAVAP